jgi:quercetin dioxygenase-like cupin family protein
MSGKCLMHTVVTALACACAITALARVTARSEPDPRQAVTAAGNLPAHHTEVLPDQIEWKDGPPSLPPGSKFVVLEGDPAKPGFFAMRAKLPDGYQVPPHFHPGIERVTVLSGTFRLGTGDKFDRAAARALPAGSYTSMPAGMRHFAWAEGETVIQVATEGPWGITYVNPSDDPRRKQ